MINDKLTRITTLLSTAQSHQIDTSLIVAQDADVLYSVQAQKRFKAASVIKLGIALYIHEQVQIKPALLTRSIEVEREDLVGGAGVLGTLSSRRWCLGDLVTLMLSLSDNSATNCLMRYFGRQKINSWLQHHFNQIELGRFFMKTSVHENTISAQTLMAIWQELFKVNDDYGRLVKQALLHQSNRNKLIACLPLDLTVYNKTGELTTCQHDCARFCFREKHLDVCVLTQFQDALQSFEAIALCQKIGVQVSQCLQ